MTMISTISNRCALIAEALGHGNATHVAREILNRYTTLQDLFDATPEELTWIPGVGPKRARQLQAIFQLSQAWLFEPPPETPTIRSPGDVDRLLLPGMAHPDREVRQVVLLNTRHRVIGVETVSVATLETTLAHPREIFKPAVRRSVAAIIVAHNHPAGSSEPSAEDIGLTSRLVSAGKLIGIEVLDHIIIAGSRWVSLRDDFDTSSSLNRRRKGCQVHVEHCQYMGSDRHKLSLDTAVGAMDRPCPHPWISYRDPFWTPRPLQAHCFDKPPHRLAQTGAGSSNTRNDR